MNVSAKTAAGAVMVMASSVLSPDRLEALLSVGLGLAGVALARQVFITKERRRTGAQPPWSETFPLTLVAMLITGVLIWERRFGLSLSVFTGLGVGWTAILLLDVVGAWVLKTGRRILGVTEEDLPIPQEQKDLVRRLDIQFTPDEEK